MKKMLRALLVILILTSCTPSTSISLTSTPISRTETFIASGAVSTISGQTATKAPANTSTTEAPSPTLVGMTRDPEGFLILPFKEQSHKFVDDMTINLIDVRISEEPFVYRLWKKPNDNYKVNVQGDSDKLEYFILTYVTPVADSCRTVMGGQDPQKTPYLLKFVMEDGTVFSNRSENTDPNTLLGGTGYICDIDQPNNAQVSVFGVVPDGMAQMIREVYYAQQNSPEKEYLIYRAEAN